ncbi:hypothetical protein C2G38_2178132 [Gigaspora rosea]|uniref:HeH/LEM domain-containing protein n=1 Tax=Gigaspora rosea TaxID=44941 RepID=A0A397VEK5_9GLOM|nr:hypothetical protein C2G38_2178132 [Gigaspora rosea]
MSTLPTVILPKISHAISQYIRLEFNIAQGSGIELAIKEICRTSVAHLEPECPKGICPDHLTIDRLKIQLTNHGVSYNNESTKQDLISLLNNILSQEPEFQKTELSAKALISKKGSWALKETQKFRKRDRGKRISKHVIAYLEGYFLASNVNKSD